MPINLPDFKNPHFFWLTMCGEIPRAEEELVRWLKVAPDQKAPFETSRGIANMRIMLGGGSGKHVHVDVFAPELVSPRLKPEKESTLSDLLNNLDRVLGKEIEVLLRGGFRTTFTELPDTGLIRSLMFKTKMGNVAIKLDGASFAIEGAPVQALTWDASLEDKISTTLESDEYKVSISDDYLTNAVNILEQGFNVFVLGKGQNEPK